MNMKRFAAVLLAQITLGSLLAVAAFAQIPSLAPKASEIDQNVTAALRDLYSHNEAAKGLGAKAKAVLVFPDIKKEPLSSVRNTDSGRCGEMPRPLATTGRRLRPTDSRPG